MILTSFNVVVHQNVMRVNICAFVLEPPWYVCFKIYWQLLFYIVLSESHEPILVVYKKTASSIFYKAENVAFTVFQQFHMHDAELLL